MLKRIFDISISLSSLIILSPILLVISLLIFLYDFSNPFYIAKRVGKNKNIFYLIKFRSMTINADKSRIDSTANDDTRLTGVGKFIRKYKIDEIPQFINVLIGNMSLVGPRPQTINGVKLYTAEEESLLTIKPGITDLSSIVFSDEGDILESCVNPDLSYNQLIKPWKSRLGIFYINNQSFFLDIKLIFLTAISIISRQRALKSINKILVNLSTDVKLIEVARRDNELVPCPPPGSDSIVTSRK